MLDDHKGLRFISGAELKNELGGVQSNNLDYPLP